jgi:hypothetical protein
MFRNMKRSVGLGLVVVVAAVAVGAYAFTASNTITDGGQAGVGHATITGYDVTNVIYTQDSVDPSTWSFVDFDLSADATEVQVKLDDNSGGGLPSSGWVDCTQGTSTIQHVSPWHVHCQLPGVDSNLDTLTVAASR